MDASREFVSSLTVSHCLFEGSHPNSITVFVEVKAVRTKLTPQGVARGLLKEGEEIQVLGSFRLCNGCNLLIDLRHKVGFSLQISVTAKGLVDRKEGLHV